MASNKALAAKLAAMPEPLRAVLEDVREDIGQLTEQEIARRWSIGQKVNRVSEDASGQYGTDPVDQMFAALPIGRDTLRPMMQFAKVYDQTDLTKLLDMKNANTGERLSWSHVAALTRIKDKTQAMTMAARAVRDNMTSRDLVREITRHNGKKSQGGRKQKKATTMAAALADVDQKTATWSNAAKQKWLADGGLADLYVTEASHWPAGRAPAALIDEMRRVHDVVMTMELQVKTVRNQIINLMAMAEASTKAPPAIT